MSAETKTILVIGGISRSLVNFRGPLLKAMVHAGHRVVAASGEPNERAETVLGEMGVTYVPLPLSRAGLNPVHDAALLWKLVRLMREHRPDVVLAYTIKAVIYGGLAGRLCRVPERYALVTGLGYALTGGRGFLSRLVHGLYRSALKGCRRVFFQNPDDPSYFQTHHLVAEACATRVNGSGVDMDHYASSPVPEEPVFLLIARLLGDKGVREYAEAARAVKARCPAARFLLVGGLDPNPNGIREDEVQAWRDIGAIEYLGHLTDVRPVLRECRVFVLPSFYREGLPRTILEAMASGRPVITTDMPGCRETVPLTALGREQQARGEPVMEGENGLLIRPRDAEALTAALAVVVEQPERVAVWGRRSREIAEERFDVHKVNRVMLDAMQL